MQIADANSAERLHAQPYIAITVDTVCTCTPNGAVPGRDDEAIRSCSRGHQRSTGEAYRLRVCPRKSKRARCGGLPALSERGDREFQATALEPSLHKMNKPIVRTRLILFETPNKWQPVQDYKQCDRFP
jgi:hypothetical protein